MTRDRMVWVLVLLGLLLGGWWLSANTEWVDEKQYRGARGEAQTNPVYAYEQVLRKLGMHVERHEQLDRLPPEGARLLLLSSNWDLLPERAERLRDWVGRGGHLILLQGTEWDDTRLDAWVPVYTVEVKERMRAKPSRADVEAAASAAGMGLPRDWSQADEDEDEDEDGDEEDDEAWRLTSTPPLFDEVGTVPNCSGTFLWGKRLKTRPGHDATWTLAQRQGTQAVRVSIGRGSVTVLNFHRAFDNLSVLSCDNALVYTAAVQAQPGATVWIFLNEKREPLLPWLWHSGWIAIVMGLLALTAALWRGAVRFGPQLAPLPRLRRSISEQVRGMGAYLHREGPDALLAAQQRALHEAALRRLPGYHRLAPDARVDAIAAATLIGREALADAMSTRLVTRAVLPQHLHLLESARRRLQLSQDERHSP